VGEEGLLQEYEQLARMALHVAEVRERAEHAAADQLQKELALAQA